MNTVEQAESLVAKMTRGEKALLLQHIARDLGDAYLPQGEDRKHWIGFDVVGGAGAPGARLNWNGPLPRREDNLWVPVP
jgi:hypothetical protein